MVALDDLSAVVIGAATVLSEEGVAVAAVTGDSWYRVTFNVQKTSIFELLTPNFGHFILCLKSK